MNRHIISGLSLIISGSLLLYGCQKDGTTDISDTIGALKLSANVQAIEITDDNLGSDALIFSWTDESVYSGAVIYSLELSVMDNKEADTYKSEVKEAMEISFSGEELNSILIGHFGIPAGTTVTVSATVNASVAGNTVNSSSVIETDVTTYRDGYNVISLTVDPVTVIIENPESDATAVTLSWKDDNIYTGNKSYSLSLNLKDNTYTITGITGNGISLTYRQFNHILTEELEQIVPEQVTIGLQVLSIVDGETATQSGIIHIDVTPYMETDGYVAMGIVGPATPGGWDAYNPAEMTAKGNGLFEWEGELTAGTLRFLCDPDPASGWEVDQFIATGADKEIVSGQMDEIVLAAVSETDRGDYMWKITIPGTYRILLDTKGMTVTFTIVSTKLDSCPDISMAGDASPGKWDLDNLPELTQEGHVWKWSGHLTTGDIQFLCDRTSNEWGEYRIVPADNSQWVDTDSYIKTFTYMPPAEDIKWTIGIAGEYDITIDPIQGTVTFMLVKGDAASGNYPSLGLIDGAAPQGWNPSDYSASTMTYDSSVRTYNWTGHLNEGDLNIFCDITATDWSSPRLTAWDDQTSVQTGEKYRMRYMENENKWLISISGTYTVTVDLHAMNIEFTLIQADELQY